MGTRTRQRKPPLALDTWFAAIAAVPGLLRPLRQALDRSSDRPVVAPAGRAGGSAAQTPNLYMFFVYTGWTTYTEANSVAIIGTQFRAQLVPSAVPHFTPRVKSLLQSGERASPSLPTMLLTTADDPRAGEGRAASP